MPVPTVLSLWFGGVTGISNALDISEVTAVVAIVMPSDWTPAVVTIDGSPDGTDFYPMHDGMTGTEITFNVSPGTMVAISPNRLRGCKAIRLRSGSHEAPPIPQGVAREFLIIVETAS